MTESEIIAEGYCCPKRLPNGEWAAIMPFMFTTGLIVGLHGCGYRTRFCYEHFADALNALTEWDGVDLPPGMWIKQKPEEVLGPGAVG